MKRSKLRSRIRREPVVAGYVRSTMYLLAAVGLEVPWEWAETAMDWGSIGLIAYEVIRARGRVRPLSR